MAKRDFKAQLVRPEPSSFDQEMYDLPESNKPGSINDKNVIHENNEMHDEHYVPFSTRITRGTFIKLKQTEYWERATITEIVETALRQYLETIETSIKALPEKEHKRLAVRKLESPSKKRSAK